MAEHGADEPVQQPTRKFVVELELDLAAAFRKAAEVPTAIQLAERALDEPDPDLLGLVLGVFRGEAPVKPAVID